VHGQALCSAPCVCCPLACSSVLMVRSGRPPSQRDIAARAAAAVAELPRSLMRASAEVPLPVAADAPVSLQQRASAIASKWDGRDVAQLAALQRTGEHPPRGDMRRVAAGPCVSGCVYVRESVSQ
jgi:hypothetical protein